MADESDEKTVPYKRFQEINDKLAAATVELEELRPFRAKVGTLEETIRQQASSLSVVREEADIYRTGFTDPTGIVVARAVHSTLPEAERPPLPAWLASDEARQHPALQPYVPKRRAPAAPPAVEAPAAETTPPPPPVAAAKPPAPPIAAGGAKPAPTGVPGKVTAEDIARTRGTPEGAALMHQWRAENGLPPKRKAS